ncbi:RNA polymerase sigma factor ShbA [Nocardioides ginsengisoli]|uniref:RNA polymerase sigma factor n=1 Tax=Nocardioides ginsengisoli TaxID=363868 RepID=A0ABW3W1V9_9ACTN
MSDDLIRRARDGDPEAWRELYESLTGRLLVWLRARPSGDVAYDPDDLVSETWLVAARSVADFQGDRDAFAGWLFGIARNHARAARRRTLRRATEPSTDEAHADSSDLSPGPDDHVVAHDRVRRLLASVPTREGEVLACTEVAGLSTRQTADALGISAAAVRVARHRGLTRLRGMTEPVGVTTAR